MKLREIKLEELTPMMKQYADIKLVNEDSILFFRLGDFYEMFFEDAVLASKLLEITLTGKSAGLKEKIPMCGVPYHAAESYIEKLVNMGYRVAIAEQLTEPGKGIVERGIVKVISKGTITDPTIMDKLSNNYIGAVVNSNGYFIFSFLDISTGDISVINTGTKISELINVVLSYDIKELVIDNDEISNLLIRENILMSMHFIYSDDYDELISDIDNIYRDSIRLLLSYVSNNQRLVLSHIKDVEVIDSKLFLRMDVHTKRNLELTETLRLGDRANSLLGTIDRTKTALGARRLRRLIENPLYNEVLINERYDLVTKLIDDFLVKDEIRECLNSVYDIERLTTKIALNSVNARDLLQLKKTISVFPKFSLLIKKIGYGKDLLSVIDLYNLLEDGIYEEPPLSLKDGYLIKDGYNKELDELKTIRRDGKSFIALFEKEERKRTGISNLKIGYNRIFGYYIEITRGQLDKVNDNFNYERKQTLANAERYISPILKEKEAIILGAEEKIISIEYKLFTELRESIKCYVRDLQFNAFIISDVDVLQSFAKISEENNYIRPVIVNEDVVLIEDSRHPVVEDVMPGTYVSNDIIMDTETSVLLITGPNMAGKSTYMRQLAITVIMSQIGCFIPAKSGRIKLFDAIYTRIGASDDLVSGKSTFMVEMDDANYAISNATSNSLILFDELGRGTATYDGIALARAILEYVHDFIGCKTLFSTHYHELTSLDESLIGLKNIHVSALEENGNISFLHKIKDGSVDRSYGIHVAALAGLPSSLIKRSKEILFEFEKVSKREVIIQDSFDLSSSLIEDEIKGLDISNMTPIEALNKLYEIKSKLN